MLAMIAGLHSPRRKPQVNAMDQVFGAYRFSWPECQHPDHLTANATEPLESWEPSFSRQAT